MNMKELTVLMPGNASERLKSMMEHATRGYHARIIKTSEEMDHLKGQRVLFTVELGDSGINVELFKMLEKINQTSSCLEEAVGSVLINSKNELFSRDIARKIILYANLAGCTFPGRPLAEATGSLKSFSSKKRKMPHLSLEESCLQDSREVVDRLMHFERPKFVAPKVLVLHASNHETSNTLSLWKMAKNHLQGCEIQEIHIENGSVIDCKGCPYKACKHYSVHNTCFYGGIMVEEIYPAIAQSDILIMLCPNYNDALSANMSAMINRLTALFRKTKFYDKYLYAIVVSGFSGSDILAQQLISSFNINKTFILPSDFVLMEIANEAKEIEQIRNIDERARHFADRIKKCIQTEE